MSHFYYTVASIPSLYFNSENIITENDFLDTCERMLDESDYNEIAKCKISDFIENDHSKNEILENWFEWEKSFRNELTKARAQKKGIEPEKYLIKADKFPGLQEKAMQIVSNESPLEGENILNKARWDFLETLESGHYFDLEKLIIYYLKLQITIRKNKFNKDLGIKQFEDIYSKTIENNI